ncbi:MAG: DUF1569 domain-containing protein [Bacteroidetes bacterium]|jgi:hypothetical protein|nr:DUF1569 domain-containing protein [Bacteroidota bacterium]
MTIDVYDEYQRLGAFYDASAALLDHPDEALLVVDTDVSGWSAAQHLYHIWLANGKMLTAVQVIHRGGGPVTTEGALEPTGRHVLEHGITRGQAQAPVGVRPPETVTREVLTETLARSRAKAEAVEELLPEVPDLEGRLPHPFMGALTAAQWLRMARLHAEHHLALARDVLAATTDAGSP